MIDPNLINTQDMAAAANSYDAAVLKEEEEKRKAEAQAAAEQQAMQERMAMMKDPHGAKPANQFGLAENATELKNAVVGGVRDTVSSIATAPERGADMANGQMQQQGSDYKPDFDPVGGDKDPTD